MVPSLAGKCTEYLRDNLKASNMFCILSHAQKFEEKDLEDRCWEVIEMQIEEALTSDEFLTLERSLVEPVVKREVLKNIKEVELFKAVDRWATKECERQGITPDGDLKRRILGEEIVKAIRFPLMSEKEFASVDTCILTFKEAEDMMKYYNDVLTSSSFFIQTPRIQSFHRCYRFRRYLCSICGWEYQRGKPDILDFTVDKPIMLHGVQHFGCLEGTEYTVSIEVIDATNGSLLGKQSGSYISEKDVSHSYYAYFGFVVLFDRPVFLVENNAYQLVSLIKGPESWKIESKTGLLAPLNDDWSSVDEIQNLPPGMKQRYAKEMSEKSFQLLGLMKRVSLLFKKLHGGGKYMKDITMDVYLKDVKTKPSLSPPDQYVDIGLWRQVMQINQQICRTMEELDKMEEDSADDSEACIHFRKLTSKNRIRALKRNSLTIPIPSACCKGNGSKKSTENKEVEESKTEDRPRSFRDFYMEMVTSSFGDDLDRLRQEGSLDSRKVEMLINCLETGKDIWSDLEKSLLQSTE
ncbi:hypothetical protein ACROYT_G038485 [Oculina patagonica]